MNLHGVGKELVKGARLRKLLMMVVVMVVVVVVAVVIVAIVAMGDGNCVTCNGLGTRFVLRGHPSPGRTRNSYARKRRWLTNWILFLP
jgi:hypothetical protein